MSEKPTRNVLITGAAGALGGALAVALAARGARPLLLDRNLKGLEAACDAVEATGGPAPGYCQLDLLKAGPEAFEELVSGLVEAYGGIDALVHCASRFPGLQPLDQVAGDSWLSVLQVNLNAAWLLTVTCLPTLRERRGDLLFLVNKEPGRGAAYWGPYGVTQAALMSLATMFGEELEGSGCRVQAVDPGPFRSALRATAYHAEDPGALRPPEEPAAALADWLCADPREASTPTIASLVDAPQR